MQVEKLQNLSEAELLEHANRCLTALDEFYDAVRLQRAQVFLAEISRRKDDDTSRRDLILEIVVIVLISIEIGLSLYGFYLSGKESRAQLTVLGNMKDSTGQTASLLQTQGGIFDNIKKSTADTVAAVGKLQTEQDKALFAQNKSLQAQKDSLEALTRMNDALNQELEATYAVAITAFIGTDKQNFVLQNGGRTFVYVYGLKLEDDLPGRLEPDVFLTPNNGSFQFIKGEVWTNRILDLNPADIPKGTKQEIPIQWYVRSADGKEYVVHMVFTKLWVGDTVDVHVVTLSTRKEAWPTDFSKVIEPSSH
jgi:hypothetical protein